MFIDTGDFLVFVFHITEMLGISVMWKRQKEIANVL